MSALASKNILQSAWIFLRKLLSWDLLNSKVVRLAVVQKSDSVLVPVPMAQEYDAVTTFLLVCGTDTKSQTSRKCLKKKNYNTFVSHS